MPSVENDVALTWVGASRDGTPMTGSTEGQTPAQLTQALYDAGRRWATVRDATGVVVGEVTRLNGKRTWWAEGQARDIPPVKGNCSDGHPS